MPEFKVNPPAFAMFRKKAMINSITGVLIALTGIFIYIIFFKETPDPLSLKIDLIIFPVIIGLVYYFLRRQLKRKMLMLESYTLVITDAMIIREQEGHQMAGIYHSEISSIEKLTRGGFRIRGKQSNDVIMVPAYMDDPAGIESALVSLSAITPQKTMILDQWQILTLTISSVAAGMGVLFATNKWLVLVCVIVFNLGYGYTLYKMYINKDIPEKTRKQVWLMALVMIAITTNAITRFNSL